MDALLRKKILLSAICAFAFWEQIQHHLHKLPCFNDIYRLPASHSDFGCHNVQVVSSIQAGRNVFAGDIPALRQVA
jgi:hypothetical protein